MRSECSSIVRRPSSKAVRSTCATRSRSASDARMSAAETGPVGSDEGTLGAGGGGSAGCGGTAGAAGAAFSGG